MVRTLLLALLAACSQPAPPADAAPGAMRLELDKSERTVSVYVDGELVETHPVAVGKPTHPTITGDFAIHRVDWNPDWTPTGRPWTAGRSYEPPGAPGNPMGRVRMVFKAPYTIHGTDALSSLGKAASHGSVRMANDTIIALAPRVMEHGGAPRSAEWVEQTLAAPTVMKKVDLPRPVPLRIVE